MEIYYYLGGQEVHAPLNGAELLVELNWDKGAKDKRGNLKGQTSLTEFEFGLGSQVTDGLVDAASLINLHRTNGLGTGVGVFEGLPAKIEIAHEGTTRILFDGYLNTSTAVWDCDRVICQGFEKANIDFLNQTADSITFSYLFEHGLGNAKITNDDFISVPYVLSSIPDNKEALLALISLAFMVDTIGRELQAITEIVSSLPNLLEWTAVIRLLLRIIYVAGLIILLVALAKRIINLLIQPIKYHDVMTVKKLCEKGAAHFGMTFKSSVIDDTGYADKLVILPKKYLHDVNTTDYGKYGSDSVLGNLTANSSTSRGYYNGTFGQLLRDLKEAINGKIVIEGTVLRLEKEDYNNSAYDYVLPPVDQTTYTLNAQDLKSNYTVEFQTDINDKNTLINYEGTLTQAITRPKSITNTDMVLMTGLETRLIPFARATRKTEDTTPEIILGAIAPIVDPIAGSIVKVINAALGVAEKILGQFGEVIIIAMIGPLNYGAVTAILSAAYGTFTSLNPQAIVNLFEALTGLDTGINFKNLPTIEYTTIADSLKYRRNMLLMENDIVEVPKLMIIDESDSPESTNINSNNSNIINSEYLYNNYHYLRNFATTGSNVGNNQHKIYSATNVPFCWDDYQLLRSSNRMKDSDGRSGELISCSWNVENQTADFEYKINETYTNNISIEIITPDGK